MRKYIPYILIVVLSFALAMSLKRDDVVKEVVKIVTDTVTVYRTDTIREPVTEFVYEEVKDTIFIEKVGQDGLKLPITQKYYSSKNYKAWVSGYRPSLDSIEVFRNTITNTITNVEKKEVYLNTTDIFLDAGVTMIGGEISPRIGTSIKFKKGLLIGADLGYYDNGMTFGVRFGYKLNK